MENVNKTIKNWLNELKEFDYPDYEKLPDIELYMEQLMTYLERELFIFKTSSLDKVITPFMINNYVKGKVIDKPIAKKYSREHISKINETVLLKNVLTIAEAKQILDKEYECDEKSDIYNNFKALSKEKYSEVADKATHEIDDINDNDVSSLNNLALRLATEANAYVTVAKRILYYTKKYEDMKKINEELKEEKKDEEENS